MLAENDSFKPTEEDNAYFLSEVAKATQTGVYTLNFKDELFFVDSIGRSILNIPPNLKLSVNEVEQLFAKTGSVEKLLQTCLKGDSFKEEMQMISFDNEEIWMHFTGKPKYDKSSNIIGIRGVFTSIDMFVRDRLAQKRHSRIIEAQNDRLLHFAHIVSHNLRSHSSNLELTLELFNDVADDERNKVFYSYLDEISNNLSATLKHLNQVVTVNSQSSSLTLIDINATTHRILDYYKKELDDIDAAVQIDFKKMPFIEYVPSFFESILDTLISNAIQYRDADKTLHIKLSTKLKKNKKLFIIKDNGRGIDLKKYGSEIFKLDESMNKINGESKDLGLFLVKNQIEALGGDIVVESKPGDGTSITIKF